MYKPGLENKAEDALSRVPPTAQLNQLTVSSLLDVSILKTEVDRDEKLKEIVNKLEKGEDVAGFTMPHGVLRYKGRLVISRNSVLLLTILHTYHDSVFGGHSGYLRTYKRLIGELYWEGMRLMCRNIVISV